MNDAMVTPEASTPKPRDEGKGQSVDGGEGNKSDSAETAELPRFPVFWLVEPPIEYWAIFVKLADKIGINWEKITRNSPSREQVPANIKAKHIPEAVPYPFLNSTLTDVLDCWREIIRPAEDSIALEPYAKFTLLIIDEECVEASPYEVKVCTDAPDEGDFKENENIGEPELKILCLRLFEAFADLKALDTLAVTPSEAFSAFNPEPGYVLCSMPPFIMKANPDHSKETYAVATPTEARWAKQRALKMRPEKMEDTVRDEQREGAVLYLANVHSAYHCAKGLFDLDNNCRKRGVNAGFIDNRLREPQIDTDVQRMMRKWNETKED